MGNCLNDSPAAQPLPPLARNISNAYTNSTSQNFHNPFKTFQDWDESAHQDVRASRAKTLTAKELKIIVEKVEEGERKSRMGKRSKTEESGEMNDLQIKGRIELRA